MFHPPAYLNFANTVPAQYQEQDEFRKRIEERVQRYVRLCQLRECFNEDLLGPLRTWAHSLTALEFIHFSYQKYNQLLLNKLKEEKSPRVEEFISLLESLKKDILVHFDFAEQNLPGFLEPEDFYAVAGAIAAKDVLIAQKLELQQFLLKPDHYPDEYTRPSGTLFYDVTNLRAAWMSDAKGHPKPATKEEKEELLKAPSLTEDGSVGVDLSELMRSTSGSISSQERKEEKLGWSPLV